MIDFSTLMYDPFSKETVYKLEQIPEFQFKSKDKDKIIAFMILVWDHNNREWQNQFTRYADLKRESAILAGFKLNSKNRFDEEIENIILGKNHEVNRAIIRYLYLSGVSELPALAAHRELLAAEYEMAFGGNTDPKERKVVRENIDKGTEKMKQYEQLVFGGSEVSSLKTELYKYMESQKLRIRPELIAESTRSGNLKQAIDG